jgi:hypothetical protein
MISASHTAQRDPHRRAFLQTTHCNDHIEIPISTACFRFGFSVDSRSVPALPTVANVETVDADQIE